jgi:hypothetical protein
VLFISTCLQVYNHSSSIMLFLSKQRLLFPQETRNSICLWLSHITMHQNKLWCVRHNTANWIHLWNTFSVRCCIHRTYRHFFSIISPRNDFPRLVRYTSVRHYGNDKSVNKAIGSIQHYLKNYNIMSLPKLQ